VNPEETHSKTCATRGTLRSRRIVGGAILASVVALTVVAFLWRTYLGPYHFLTVTPGVLYRSGTLDPDDLADILERYRIRTVVSLRTSREQEVGDWYMREAAICQKRAVDFIDLPMGSDVPDESQIDTWLHLISSPDSLPVLVHCAHGVQRTGVMVAIYEIERLHKTKADVLNNMPFANRLHEDARQFILNYVPRSQQKSAPNGVTAFDSAGPQCAGPGASSTAANASAAPLYVAESP
jgi:protein tyrosine phosphatase (PTP) superfamily phosphohydrolase (DUF442 family)